MDKSYDCDVVKRNELWLQEKKRKDIQRREDQLVADLEDCTFVPSMVAK